MIQNTGVCRNGNRPQVGRKAGFSLIEILVVLVILLVGILSILRLFPGGFLTIQRTGEMTAAASLSQQQLDEQKNLSSLAESIVALDAKGNIDKTVLPDDLGDVYDPNTGVLLYDFSNINKIRRVVGEGFRIPVPNSNGGQGDGSPYMLKLGPVYNTFGEVNGVPTDSLVVRSAPLERTLQSFSGDNNNSSSKPVLTNESQYAIDYANNMIAFFPRLGTGSRQFVLSYSYYERQGNFIDVKSVPSGPNTVLTVPDLNPNTPINSVFPLWQPLFGDGAMVQPANFAALKNDSEDVSRKFRLAGAGTVVDGSVPTWTNDPYEYAWFSQQETDNTNVGVIIFNPRGYSQQVQTSTGVRTLSARVDYNIFDNHVIRDDRSMPSSGPYDVKLSLPFLLTSGDILKDQTTYNGIFRDSSGKSTAGDIYVYNANTGDEIMEIKGGVARLDSGLKPIGVKVDAITGTIRFNTDDVEKAGLQNVSLRLLYRTQKDWGMQVQKAHAHYVEALTAAAVDYKSYWVQEGGTRIYFPRSEAGKTVVLGEYFVNTINGIKHFSNEAYQINDNTALFVNGLTWIDLKSQHELEAVQENWFFPNDKDSPKGESVLNVQGASLKSRIVWAGSSDKTQDAKGNPVFKTRWRKLDTDTLLMQTPSQ